MSKNELLDKKLGNFFKTVNREEGAYIPTAVNDTSGAIAWAGKRTIDVVKNQEEFVSATTDIYRYMWADVIFVFANLRSPRLAEAFLHTENRYGPDGTTMEHMQLSPMEKDEYDQLIANPDRFVSEVLVPRKFPELYESNYRRSACLSR